MKKVNFKELSVETSIDKFETMDLRKEIGNALYKRAENVPMSDLARGIYHSEGPVEMEDQDCAEMMQILEKSFVRFVYTAILNAVETVLEDNSKKQDNGNQ